MLLCSPYKFCGPHLGVGLGRRELLESWRPYKVRPSASEPVGHRFETGTLPYELLAALSAALRYLDSIGGIAAVAAWERKLGERLLAGLPADRPAVRAGPTWTAGCRRSWSTSPASTRACCPGSSPSAAIGVWSGDHYYSLGLHERIAWGDALRIGLAHYNTLEEIDRCCTVLGELVSGTLR